MRGKLSLLAGVCASAIAFPAFAQSANDDTDTTEIVVTAQRSSERLQDVPIAVSAFNAEALEKQQIKNTSDLQLTLPNITFTKTNFTGSSFTIRGIGDLCVGDSCDSATAIHMNNAPLFGTRLFEGEFYDLAQIEVLRGPQGTLFGRNATSGVVNFQTAKPDLSGMAASAEAEYGNYNAVKAKGMVNVPLSDSLGVRVAGYYLNRDGYTTNLYDGSNIDGRDQYGIRGSIRFEPTATTRLNLMVQYFQERDNRLRAQKIVCQRDPIGALGCLAGVAPGSPGSFQMPNGNATLLNVFASKEVVNLGGSPLAPFLGVASLYGPDSYAKATNPADPRVVNSDYNPQYFTRDLIAQAQLEQELGGGLTLQLGGQYEATKVDSQQDYISGVQDRTLFTAALTNVSAMAAGAFNAVAPGLSAYFAPVVKALIPNGPSGQLCTSLSDPTLTGVFSGHSYCSDNAQDFDRSNAETKSWSIEGIVSSKWDGPFNMLIGAIYAHSKVENGDYYVNSFGLDYLSAIGGAGAAYTAQLPVTASQSYFSVSPFYRNNTDYLTLNSYGIFGEAYYKLNDQLKLTVGLRYNHDKKDMRAVSTLLSGWIAPTGIADAKLAPGYANFDGDPKTPGIQNWLIRSVPSSAWTGRAVLDYQITPDNLLYASFSRGYKSGGINPPVQSSGVQEFFRPEYVTAYEIGSKNTFANGKLTFNLTGFYYNYKDLQLSKIVSRTSVNENISAHIYGLEAEAIVRPTRELTLNMNASYLHTSVSQDIWSVNPRDPSGGNPNAVIIKDVTTTATCAISSSAGADQAAAYVAAVNGEINASKGLTAQNGLRAPQAFPANSGLGAKYGAFSICSAVLGSINAPVPNGGGVTLGQAFGVQVSAIHDGVTYGYGDGIPVNLRGNKLPGAPDYKFSAGAQYAIPMGSMTVTPRADFIYTGRQTGNVFNGIANEISSYSQVNAQVQIDGPDKKWFARAWVQNITKNQAITGLYLADATSGNFTNIFTLEPRRYGLTAGMKF